MRVSRTLINTVRQLVTQYPVLAVTGPRQSGKTTLVRETFPDRPYISLEDLDERAFADEDPRGFMDRFPDGAVFDEAQQAPGLFSYLQTKVDQDGRMGL
ncbi:MAG: putative AAA+ superfamily ATPase [Rhodothermales bacterium]|jgi:predicted AAA+ superfamily ATPase